MFKFIMRRILQAIPLLFIISLIGFSIINFAPGNPVYMFINPDSADPGQIEAITKSLGLDKPVHIRYFLWVKSVLTGNMGNSFLHSKPVVELIFDRIPNTMQLASAALLLAFAVAIPAGIISAIKKNSIFDYICSTISFIGVSLPSFWFGLMLLLLFSLKLGWLPTGGMRSNFDEYVLADRLRHVILPAVVLGMGNMASIMRYMRSSMLEVIRQDYIRTARSKGLAERKVILKHALRNALLPIITLIGLVLPSLMSGAVVTETIFAWPGMGRLSIEATFSRDYPLQMGVILISSVMVVIGSLLADCLYAVADPRIKYN